MIQIFRISPMTPAPRVSGPAAYVRTRVPKLGVIGATEAADKLAIGGEP